MVLVCIPCWSEGLSRCLLLLFFTLDYEHTSTKEHILAQKLNNRVFEFLVKNLLSYMFYSFTIFLSIFFFQGSVAKKPYNPILGETFRCFWVLPECEDSRTEVRKNGSLLFQVLKGQCHYVKQTRAATFLNGFKNIPGKASIKRVHSNDAFVNVGN